MTRILDHGLRSVCVVICLGLLVPATGQSDLGLLFPLGVPLTVGSGTMFMNGGAGTGVPYEHNILFANPANLGSLDRTVFSSLGTLDFTSIRDDGRSTSHLAFQPRQVSFGFAVDRFGTLGFSVDRRFDATTKFRGEFPLSSITAESLQTVSSFRRSLSRNGGLTVWQVGWGRSLGKYVQVGLSYERAYLRMDGTRILETFLVEPRGGADTLRTITTVRDSTLTEFGGNGFRMGVMVPIGSLTLGVSGEYFFLGTATQDRALLVDSVTMSNAQGSEFDLRLPPSLSIGASYRFSPEWFAALDLATTVWDQYEGAELADPGIGQAFSVGGGAEFVPAPNVLSPKYWETIRYRAGLRFGGLPAEGSKEWALGLGVGLPLRASGLLDIGVEYGQRWSDHYEDFREDLFSIAIGINGGRKWTRSAGNRY